jgi:hypothetical protein
MPLEKHAVTGSITSGPRRFAWYSFLAVMLGLAPVLTALSQETEEPSWKWPESRWREAVDRVRAGPPFANGDVGKAYPVHARPSMRLVRYA